MARDQLAYSKSRRTFFRELVDVLVFAPGIAIAQASKAVRRIGVLEPGAPDSRDMLWIPQRQAEPLQELGWVEGKNLHVERRYANGRSEALQPLAEELVRAQVEIIVTAGAAATLAAKHATTTIPIVFRSTADPVLFGLVASLARPGGNVTGYSEQAPEVTAKILSVLKELLPGLQRIGVLWEAGAPFNRTFRDQFERVCQSLDLLPINVDIGAANEIDGAIEQMVRQRVQALVLLSGRLVDEHSREIVDAAMKHSLPTMADESEWVRQDGALIAYSTTFGEQCRRRAEYIDRILRGAKPANLPVQQPTKFELAISLKTARALGITVPKELLLRADEVIQ
jgi:putative ABC transport system substrate-binding protein